MPRVDLRVHSRYSDRPTNFFLKRLKAPESLTEPEAAYALAKRRGMDFFTLTDSDNIAGCLQLAHHGDVFTSCETTVEFPEDECMIELLLFGLREGQLQHLLGYRRNIYQVRDYLLSEGILHAVAAPLDILNLRLSPDHIERLLLLFDHFETRSGARHPRTNNYVTTLLDHLTPEFMNELQKKWGIEPASPRPWQKGYLGGSGDYCCQYIGLTWTEAAKASTPAEFLTELQRKSGSPGGVHGTSLGAAHSMYRVAFQYYQKNLRGRNVREPDIVTLVLSRVLQPDMPRRPRLRQLIAAVANMISSALRMRRRTTFLERRLVREFLLAYNALPPGERLRDIARDDLITFDERLCALVDRVIGRVTYRLFLQASREFDRGHFVNAVTLGSAILPLQAVMGPYLYAFDKLNKDRSLIAQLDERFGRPLELPSHGSRRKKIAWFSDTVNDVNGVSLTLNKMADVAEALDADLTIISSVIPEKASPKSKFLNFEPMGEIPVPDYDLQKLTVPPGIRILRYLETAGFSEYVISTPGPVGLIAMFAARLFHVPCRAIYHNDFPQHVRHITGDEGLEAATWIYMRWFYGKADVIYSPSAFYRDQLVEHGFDGSKIFLFNRGTDLEFFNPRHHDEAYWEPWKLKNRPVLVYIGRISREKNLDVLLKAFLSDPDLCARTSLAMVGDGPYLNELRARYVHPSVAFCGFQKGKSLARAYASADVFVFPSTTDTYGNSVLEAQASGLPAIVSDEGGPKDIITPGESGIVLPGHDVEGWRAAMRELAFNSEKRLRMAAAARARATTRDWTTAFHEFWNHQPYQAATRPQPRTTLVRP
ncbi:glycosyltransferase [bacterium]|nr:glycosyltransferase [bacterium]MBU1983241.1 glycosyltransferase [bacterium]